MVNILHRVVIKCSANALFEAILSQHGLSQWWTHATSSEKLGGTAKFVFGPNKDSVIEMKIVEVQSNRLIKWRCITGPWTETGEFEFVIQEEPDGCVLLFSHYGWSQANDFYRHCNGKWAYFLISSLKPYLEKGLGAPHPQDPDM